MNRLKKYIVKKLAFIIAPIIKILTQEIVEYEIYSWFEADEQSAKVGIISLYPVCDVPIERLASKTDTIIDDAIVDGILSGIERVAIVKNIDLPNLDRD